MILCDNLVKIYKTTDIEVVALQGLDLEISRGEFMAIIGNSGSGKSTLLNMLGGLDRPSAGTLLVDGQNLLKMNDMQLCEYKRKTVGFVWQNNARNLIPYLTAVENIELPMIIERNAKKRRERALELLDMVGLSHRHKNRLRELSGGEQQRVAIAIALANTPKLLLADEPTCGLQDLCQHSGASQKPQPHPRHHRRHRNPRPQACRTGGSRRQHPRRPHLQRIPAPSLQIRP